MLGLAPIDFLVILIYLIGITWIGLRAGRGAKTAQEFFLPRTFGKWMLTMAAFGTGTSSEQAVTVASKSYTSGASGIWYQWLFLFSTPFFWVVSPLLRRFRAVTTADIFEARFGHSVAMLFCGAGLLKSALSLGLLFKGTGAVLVATTAGAVDGNHMVILLAASLLIYSLAGGLSAAIVTEFFQSILTIIFSFLLLPFVLHAVGGFAGMKRTINDPTKFDLFVSGDVGVFHVVMLTLSGLAMLVMIPHNLGVATSSRKEADGQFGFVAGAFLKRICTAAWCLTGVAGAAWFAGKEINPDHLYGLLAQEFLPQFLPGLLGLFIASVLAAAMSTCSSMLVAGSALLTNNFYRSLRPDFPEQHYVSAGRVAMIAVAFVGVGFAFWFPGVVKGLEIILAVTPIMGIIFWLGFFWQRLNAEGAWAGTVTGYLIWGFTTLPWGAEIVGSLAPVVMSAKNPLEVAFPWQTLLIFSATIFGAITVALRTPPPASERISRFYKLSRTHITPGEIVPGPCQLPSDAVTPEPIWCFAWGSFRIPRPERRTTTGFLICVGIVVAMILCFQAILAL